MLLQGVDPYKTLQEEIVTRARDINSTSLPLHSSRLDSVYTPHCQHRDVWLVERTQAYIVEGGGPTLEENPLDG